MGRGGGGIGIGCREGNVTVGNYWEEKKAESAERKLSNCKLKG